MNVTDRLRSALASLAERDLLRTIRPRPEGVISLAGNDYLGAGADTALREAFFESPLSRFGLASGSSALLFGESEAHEGLREVLRRLYGRESLLFPSGWQLNTGFIAALAAAFGKDVFFLADRLVHASTIDGLLAAKRHGAGFLRYPHNDCAALERLLERTAPKHGLVVILTESVFSMDGDRADLTRLVALKKRWRNVLLAVDDGKTRNAVFTGEADDVAHEHVGTDRDRFGDDARFVALHLGDFGGLKVGREVLVDEADAAFLRKRDGEVRFRHRVHGGGNHRDVEREATGDLRGEDGVAREDGRVGGDEQNVVEGEGFLKKTHNYL